MSIEVFLVLFRREKNETEIIDEKSSVNLKFSQMKKIFQSNQMILDQLGENISSINRNHSILINQISTIQNEKFHSTEHLNRLQSQSLVKQQQILDIQMKFNQIKQSIDLNNQKLRQITFEKQNISSFLLQKQRCIVLLYQHIESNNQTPRLNICPLVKKLHQLRNEIKHELQSLQSQDPIDLKRTLLSLRNDLFDYKKKTNNFQHRIHRQIFNDKSLIKGKNVLIPPSSFYDILLT